MADSAYVIRPIVRNSSQDSHLNSPKRSKVSKQYTNNQNIYMESMELSKPKPKPKPTPNVTNSMVHIPNPLPTPTPKVVLTPLKDSTKWSDVLNIYNDISDDLCISDDKR